MVQFHNNLNVFETFECSQAYILLLLKYVPCTWLCVCLSWERLPLLTTFFLLLCLDPLNKAKNKYVLIFQCIKDLIVVLSVFLSADIFHIQKLLNKVQTVFSFMVLFRDLPPCGNSNDQTTTLHFRSSHAAPFQGYHGDGSMTHGWCLQLFLSPPAQRTLTQTSQCEAQQWVETPLLPRERNWTVPSIGLTVYKCIISVL